ncbi:hypothetical protein [Sinorhizobium fredii]|uniref:hypothetical protein n=1 Tax=Rhizobium fredii TaxID=380 RepID=UPI001FCBEFC1|nr:hypothetical protein [Sinorhizobium fredii]WOS64537.1 hypothetical protein SFGR64A_00655 [Sinorhizobium fredii GR64]
MAAKALYDFVLKRCPKISSKKLVRASLLALTDPDLKDRNVLSTIYALAIKHRLDEVRIDEIDLVTGRRNSRLIKTYRPEARAADVRLSIQPPCEPAFW